MGTRNADGEGHECLVKMNIAALHPDDWLARAAVAAHMESTFTFSDLDHSEVHISAGASIESYLFLAVGAAALKCREVQKAEIDRLLELVGVRTRQHNPRAMRFMEPDVVRGMLISPGRKRLAISFG